MGTKKLTVREKEDIKRDLEGLLARPVQVIKCPITTNQQFYDLVLNSRADEFAVAEETVKRYGAVLNRSYIGTILAGGYRVSGHFHAMTTIANPAPLSEGHVLYEPLVEYCSEMLKAQEDFYNARNTISLVIENSTTAGQVVRVLPFLGQFLGKQAKKSLEFSERASRWPSGVPNEWDMRDRVKHLKQQLALASLLEVDHTRVEFTPNVSVFHEE